MSVIIMRGVICPFLLYFMRRRLNQQQQMQREIDSIPNIAEPYIAFIYFLHEQTMTFLYGNQTIFEYFVLTPKLSTFFPYIKLDTNR